MRVKNTFLRRLTKPTDRKKERKERKKGRVSRQVAQTDSETKITVNKMNANRVLALWHRAAKLAISSRVI